MSVFEAQDRIDAEEFEGWMAFFKARKQGGARSPDTEIADIIAAKALSFEINLNNTKTRTSTRDVMLFPPEVTQKEIDARFEAAKQTMRMLHSILPKKVVNVK